MDRDRQYSSFFLPMLAAPLRERMAQFSHLEHVLRDLWEAGQDAWPDITLDVDLFMEYLAARIPAEADAEKILLGLKAGDLYLVCAILQGDAVALAAFETHFFPAIEAALRRRDPSGALVEDVKQLLCQKLLVGDGVRSPKISLYGGRGDLRSWISVTAVREAIDLLRKGNKEQPLEDNALMDLAAPGEDQEIQYLKRLYRGEFKSAFTEALAELPRRERNVLRHHLLDGLNIDQIGALYNVHRATAARWISRARETLLASTRRSLMQRLKVNKGEFESIMRLIQSHFDVSVQHFMKNSKQ